jgi:phosphatidylglycerol lysyltransferase
MKKKLLHSLGPLFGLLLFAVALWVLHHELKAYHFHDIVLQVEDLPTHRLLLALSLTILNYLIMTGYDTLALRYIHHPLAYPRIALASFIGYAFSNNIGLSMIAGGSVRYRLYSGWGFSVLEITKVVAFCSLTLWLGFFTLGGAIFLVEPMVIPKVLHLPFASARPIAMIFLALVTGYLLWSALRKRPLRILGWEFPMPSSNISLSQITIASLDWVLAGSVLFALLPSLSNLSFPGFLGIYMLAQFMGLASQVPGGLGVFETVVILLLSPTLPASETLGALLAYRGIYYLLPLFVSLVLLGAQEALQEKTAVQRFAQVFGQWVFGLIPHMLAFTTFLGGAILLFSGAMPAVSWRLAWLKDILPLPLIEISHFLGSIVGAGLLILAWGLLRRLDAAYILTVAFLSIGVVLSLLKGFDYEEAIALSVMLGALVPCGRYFYRRASLWTERFTPGWIAAITLVLSCSVWLGIFSYKHVEYSHDLWWRFALSGDAPRFLRATVGAIAVTLFFFLARLLRPVSPKPGPPGPEDFERIVPIIQRSGKTYSNLALLGDKAFLFSQTGNAFIMYNIEGRTWVAMGDPVGPVEEWPELAWRFRGICDRYDGWAVFYEVLPGNLRLYLDLGLTLLKLGEEGRVPLESFSLEGSHRKGLRHTNHQLQKEGCIFEVVSPDGVPSFLPDMKRVSDGWLEGKKAAEKAFSLGFFREDYLKRFPAGLVRKEGRIIAFANIWSGAEKEELSIDLMRYLPEAPHGVMDYLFIQLLLWGKQEGYRWFNFGMAPLSGLEDRALAPLWDRVGSFIFRHGEHFYNFQGLRQYKEKFHPEWEPKFLASPGGLALPRVLTNLASLISGRSKGMFSK